MNLGKIHDLIYFIILAKGQEDINKDLGMTHIIKYLYLADLTYYKKYKKQYTDIKWIFYNFGPWSNEVSNEIKKTIAYFGIEENSYSTPKYGEFLRFKLSNPNEYKIFKEKVPRILELKLNRYIHEFGTDTEELLHFVYNTEPMLNASPNELLDFKFVASTNKRKIEYYVKDPSNSHKEYMKKLKEKFKNRKKNLSKRVKFKVIYDEIYFEGVKLLEGLDEVKPSLKGTVKLDKSLFKSKSRHDPEIY